MLDRLVAAFCVVPYFAREQIEIPDSVLNVDLDRIWEMQRSSSIGDEEGEQPVVAQELEEAPDDQPIEEESILSEEEAVLNDEDEAEADGHC